MNTLTELALNFLDLFLDSAPWLLLGLFMAGMIKMFVPMSWMQKQLGGHGIKPTVKAAIFGAPLPLCSCGVIPAAVGLRRSGASKSATTAFLVATPETGVDSVSVSYVLLGPFMAVVRPITAVVSAIVAGLLVGRDNPDTNPEAEAKPTPKFTPTKGDSPSLMAAPTSSCCASKAAPVVEAKASSCCSSKAAPVVEAKASSCCASKKVEETKPESAGCCSSKTVNSKAAHEGCCGTEPELPAGQSVVGKLVSGVHYASTDLVRDTTLWLLVGLFFAALVNTFVPASFLSQWGDGILAMTVMVLVSIPMYICATASTPIAAGLLLAGVSPGAVLVFMMAGPATNIATLGVVRNELGKRALWAYLTGVIGTAMLFGFAVDYAVAEFGFKVMPLVGEEHRMLPHWLVYGSGVLLAVLMIKAMMDKWLPARPSMA
ncbi:SO_0444 family Cu/Zn efflux transporter [Ferrimonas balearica]|uniref:SO_0444 family Cu/Zn efflux transporter n=1 Tax=Ferrimonas balearica TaxID=44012 RepID=UPI001C99F506|nr:SO_0444 family Cu/Zn efflux transporter [Ferrimonas balearica]MBY5923134.1 SO_0444 family Cu/Zn efflux transporter [Ferrimonas balearica]MBY5997490.1 SO_0444 family Cu/Zn efflux transporter [Ferrimonas balearica]